MLCVCPTLFLSPMGTGMKKLGKGDLMNHLQLPISQGRQFAQGRTHGTEDTAISQTEGVGTKWQRQLGKMGTCRSQESGVLSAWQRGPDLQALPAPTRQKGHMLRSPAQDANG